MRSGDRWSLLTLQTRRWSLLTLHTCILLLMALPGGQSGERKLLRALIL